MCPMMVLIIPWKIMWSCSMRGCCDEDSLELAMWDANVVTAVTPASKLFYQKLTTELATGVFACCLCWHSGILWWSTPHWVAGVLLACGVWNSTLSNYAWPPGIYACIYREQEVETSSRSLKTSSDYKTTPSRKATGRTGHANELQSN
jgi:hypothetical protein